MKILFILPEYYPHSGGGISTYYLHYIEALKPYVQEIKVIVGSGYTQSEEEHDLNGISIEYLKPKLYQNQLEKFSKFDLIPEYKKNIAAAWAMWEQTNRGEGFDIIECTDFGLGFIPWIVNHQKPVIARLHGSAGQIEMSEPHLKEGLLGDLFRHTELNLLQHADQLITHSTANQLFWKNILQQDITLISPVFSTKTDSISFEEKEPFGVVCARIQQWKGPDILCKALKVLGDENILIKWYGKDTNYDHQNSKSTQLKAEFPTIWGTKIAPYKPIQYKDLHTIQKNAKFAVIPSTWDMYNFTGLEYLNAGTALICSDGAGVSEIIEDGVNGFKYSKDDYHALADCIRKVQSLSKTEHDRIVMNARQTLNSKLCPLALIKVNLLEYKKASTQFTPTIANDYQMALFEPSEIKYQLDELLDKQPLKKLITYVIKRIRKKI
ncbi:glycosyltransferase family 4 protein [Pedobacter rhizosphaerae]|uniref:Glycosyltransferase involved in cell wall bisynthesis n=1 Tax=Pedobacter rhizosphaerae TaxID=390241 RepID=A0A1H9N6A9_9SPHI|nr:glycosyltransferase family 4 protein [Pedobacter rhizosphaerae]SER31580.1 Glycosyltransferase involved in cell wall bisynthesis [Pedobacter rhizosphaerae]